MTTLLLKLYLIHNSFQSSNKELVLNMYILRLFVFFCCTYDLFRREIKQSWSQDSRSKKTQENKPRYHRVPHFPILWEVASRALPQVLKDLAHKRGAVNGALGDGTEYPLDVVLEVGQVGFGHANVLDAREVNLAWFSLSEDEIERRPESFVEVLEADEAHCLVHHLGNESVASKNRRRISAKRFCY